MEEKKQHTLTWTVTDDMTAKRIGTAGAKILSTPNMLALMEGAALELAREFLDDGDHHRRGSARQAFGPYTRWDGRCGLPPPSGKSSAGRCGLTSKCLTRRANDGEGWHLRIMVPDKDRSQVQ